MKSVPLNIITATNLLLETVINYKWIILGPTCYDVEGDVGDDHVCNVYDGDDEQEHLGADDEVAAGLQDADEKAGAGCHCHQSYQKYNCINLTAIIIRPYCQAHKPLHRLSTE